MYRTRLRALALLGVAALLASACGSATGPADPTAAVTDAVRRTFDRSFAFDVHLEIDDAAASQLGSGEPVVSQVLRTLRVTGTVDGPAVRVTVEALGSTLAELRRLDATHTYWRIDAAALAAATDGDLVRKEMLEGLPEDDPTAREAATALLDGQWVGIVGETDASNLPGGMGMTDPGAVRTAIAEHLGASPAELADRFLVASEDAGGQAGRRIAVQVRVRELARAWSEAVLSRMGELGGGEDLANEGRRQMEADLEGVPATVSGVTVTVAGRLLEQVAVDLFELVRSASTDPDTGPEGSLTVVVDLSDHGTAGSVAAPDGAAEFQASQIGVLALSLRPFETGLPMMLGGFGMGLGQRHEVVQEPVSERRPGELPAPAPARPVPSGQTPPAPPPATVQSTPVPAPGGSSETTSGSASASGSATATAPSRPTEDAATPRTAYLDLAPNSGPPGSTVAVTGEDFEAAPVEVHWGDEEGPVLVTAHGPDFTTTFTVPDVEPGQYEVTAVQRTPEVTSFFTVHFKVTAG